MLNPGREINMSTAAAFVGPALHLKNILFTTDFSEFSSHALPYAEALAETFGARIHLCHAITPASLAIGAPEAAPTLYEAECEAGTKELAQMQNDEERKGLRAYTVLESGPLNDVIDSTIKARKIDLVVAGTHGRTGMSRLLLGSSTEEICRSASCPVLTVGPWLTTRQKLQFKRILMPVDFSPDSVKVLPTIVGLAKEYGSTITMLHVMPIKEVFDAKLTAISKSLAMRASFENQLGSCKHEFVVDFGETAEAILRVSNEKKADLIAIGIRNGFGGPHLRSSIAYRIMAQANCPVLTCG
jgi:nucleotide-binding universal stress UspA family protein